MSMNWSKINAAKKIWKNGFEEANAGFSRPTWQPKHSSPRRKMPSEYGIKRQSRSSNCNRRGKRNHVIVGNHGPCCPQCRRPTQIREPLEHRTDGTSYYTRWFYCTNRTCRVTTHFLPGYKAEPAPNCTGDVPRKQSTHKESQRVTVGDVIEEARAHSGPCPWD